MGTDWPGNDLHDQAITNVTDAPSCCLECNRLFGSGNAKLLSYLECLTCVYSDVKAFVFQTDFGRCYCKSRAANPVQCPVCQGSKEIIPVCELLCLFPCSVWKCCQEDARRCSVTRGVDSYGYDLRGPIEDVMRARDCCNHCRQYGPRTLLLTMVKGNMCLFVECVAWMWRRDFSRCFLKSITVPFTNCTECFFGTP